MIMIQRIEDLYFYDNIMDPYQQKNPNAYIVEYNKLCIRQRQNLNESGVLLFAFNNKAVNYVEQAEFCCKKIRKHLQLPVTIVTADIVPNKDLFDQIIRIPKEGRTDKKLL